MEKLSAVRDGVANLPLRPLLYATGAAAMAVSIYFCAKRDKGGKKITVDLKETNVPRGLVYDQATEPPLVQLTEVLQDQMPEAIAEANKKIQKLVVFNIQLEERVRELEKLLSEARRDCDMQTKVSQAGVKETYQNGMETIAQLEVEMLILTNQVETLKDTVEEMGNQLCGTYRECEKLKNKCEQERGAQSILQAENTELKETLMQQQELQNVLQTEAEENNQMAIQTIAKLEKEKSDLRNQVETLRNTIKGIGNQLSDSHKECSVLMSEHRQEQEAYNILQAENDELKKTIQCMKREKIIKISLAEAKEKCQKAVETLVQMETEKSIMTNEVETLKDTMQDMGNRLYETHLQCIELMNDHNQKEKAHNILQSKHKQMKERLKQCEELLMEHELEDNSILKIEKDKMKMTTTAIVCVCICLCVCIYIYLFPHLLGTFCPFYH